MTTTKTEFVLTARDDTQAAFRSVQTGLGALKTKADSFVSSSAAGLAGGLLTGILGVGFTATVKNTIDELDKISKAAQQVGLTTEAFSALTYAGGLSGVEFEAMGTSLGKLSVKMQEAASGSKESAEIFKDLGINVKTSSGELKTSDQVFAEIADRFANMKDGAGKTALAIDIFGKSGAKLVPLLNNGASGLKDMADEAARLGGIIDSKLARQAENFNDNIDRLSTVSGAAGRSIANDMLPALVRLSSELLAGIKNSDGFLDALVKYGLTNPFKDQAERVRELNAEAAKLEDRISIGRGSAADEERLRSLNQQIAYYAEINRLKNAPTTAPVTLTAPTRTSQATGGNAGRADQAARLIDTLDKEIAVRALDLSTTEKLTAAEKQAAEVRQQLAAGTLKATASQRAMIEGKLEFLVAADKEIAQQNEFNASLEKAGQAMLDHRQKMVESIGAAEDLAATYGLTEAQLSVVTQARLEDALAIAAANGASADTLDYLREEIALRGQLTDALIKVDKKRIEQQTTAEDKTNEFAQQAARNIQNSLADFIFDPFANGADKMAKKFGQTLQRMAADAAAARIGQALFGDLLSGGKSTAGGAGLIEKGINAAGSWLSSINWASLFAFESGGIMTSAGPLPLNKYANGGIATSPQLAMFGEGSRPEAYVPLPDGRNIPVKMAGPGGGGMVINQTITVGQGADKAEVRRSAAAGARAALGAMNGAQRYA